jgi:hypothetical protein
MIFTDYLNNEITVKIDKLFSIEYDSSLKFIDLASGRKNVVDRGLKFDYINAKIKVILNKAACDSFYNSINNNAYEQRQSAIKFQSGENIFGPSTPINSALLCAIWVESEETVGLNVKSVTVNLRTAMSNIVLSGISSLQSSLKILPSYTYNRINSTIYFDVVSSGNRTVEINRSHVEQDIDIAPILSSGMAIILNYYYGNNRGKSIAYANFPTFTGITLPYNNANYTYRILGIKNIKKFGEKRWTCTMNIACEI